MTLTTLLPIAFQALTCKITKLVNFDLKSIGVLKTWPSGFAVLWECGFDHNYGLFWPLQHRSVGLSILQVCLENIALSAFSSWSHRTYRWIEYQVVGTYQALFYWWVSKNFQFEVFTNEVVFSAQIPVSRGYSVTSSKLTICGLICRARSQAKNWS